MSTGIDKPHNRDSDDGPRAARFGALLEEAIHRFRDETHLDLLAQPYGKFLECDSVDDLVSTLKKQNKAFDNFRAHEENIRAVLAPIFRLVRVFLETGSEVAAASATRGVSEVYDALGVLFRRLGMFLGRLDIYLQSPSEPNAALKNIFISIFFKLFAVLRIVTKYLKLEDNDKKKPFIVRFSRSLSVRRRMKDFGQVLLGNTEVKDVLAELDDLTKEEGLATAATTLVVTQEIRADVQDGWSQIRIPSAHSNFQSARKDVGTDIRDWLDPPNPSSNHDQLRKSHQSNTCEWFFGPTFNDWKAHKNGFYWVNGRPGSGKSVLSSRDSRSRATTPSSASAKSTAPVLSRTGTSS
ncbi:hypothetical protein K488DRAFT_72459 [Vararia minispora EC-137]|uniref:Uncharacterized protein n=1 Tax=Vararia minispora EC-137 TaxID=1314806 RepID=A0ACB8QEN9_9AGAM|nr:hypothetical protein K488DRAFT_72459 [Vararia minispora EC-137]